MDKTKEELLQELQTKSKQLEIQYFKTQGAIEILSSMVEEENKAHSQSPAETLKGSHKEDK